MTAATNNTSYTLCGICEQGCGLKVTTRDQRVVKIEPDKDNPYSWRDYCIKGAKAHLALEHPQRITQPMKRVGDHYEPASYEEAIADISQRLNTIVSQHGSNALASYTGNPNGFNFGSALFQTLLLDAIGTTNRYWVASVDQNALHVVSEQLYGNPWVSLQADIDYCDYFLLIGTNPQVSTMCWIGYSPDGWKRVLARKKDGAKLVIVDPRETESAAKASEHIAPLPESDWALVLAMINIIFERGWHNIHRGEQLKGIDKLQAVAKSVNLTQLSQICDIPLEIIERISREFARAPRAMAIARTGVAQGRNGVLALWLVQALNFICNRVEAEGGMYYSSGVIDLLAAGDKLFPHSNATSRLRGQKNVAGSHSLAELPDEITTPGEGQIKALIMNSGNPVISGPEGDKLDAALAQLDLFVVVDQFQRESHRHAHWLIPGDHFLERSEINPLLQALSPSPRAQMSQAVVPLPEGMRYEWEFFRDLGLAMKVPLLGGQRWLNPLITFSIKLSHWSKNKGLAFSPRWLARLLVNSGGKFRWKDIKRTPHGLGDIHKRPEFGSLFNKLSSTDGKIDLAPPAFIEHLKQTLTSTPMPDPHFPLQIIGRRRMQMMNSWSTETSMPVDDKTATGHEIEINSRDAEQLGIKSGDAVRVSSKVNQIAAIASVSEKVRTGVVVMEHGWGSRTFDPKTGESSSTGVNRNLLIANADVDPLSRVPRLNGTHVKLELAY